MNDRRHCSFPGFVRYNRFVPAIGIIDFQLREEAIGWGKETHSRPSDTTSVPSVPYRGADGVLAFHQQAPHVIGLIQDSFTVISKLRREDVHPHAASVETHAIAAKRGYIEPGALDFLRECKLSPQLHGGLRHGSGIAQPLVRQIADDL